MPTVVRPELELARAVRVTARAGVRDYVLGGAVLAAEWRTMPAGLFRGRPVDANEGDETSDQFVHLPPTPQPSSDYRFVHLPYDRLRKQRCRSTKMTMRCICASEGIPRETGGAGRRSLSQRRRPKRGHGTPVDFNELALCRVGLPEAVTTSGLYRSFTVAGPRCAHRAMQR